MQLAIFAHAGPRSSPVRRSADSVALKFSKKVNRLTLKKAYLNLLQFHKILLLGHFKQWFGGQTQYPIDFMLVFLVVYSDIARERFTVLTLTFFAMKLNSRLAQILKSVAVNAFFFFEGCTLWSSPTSCF